ncbi:hypothetical protein HAL1_06745 [Halomonas sp. HAL1]|nr:hypothetical protein HAL1_06745 [Halomonas sp. HAL1]
MKAAKRIEREAMLTSQKADKALAESEQQYDLAKTALAAASSTFKAYRDK